MGDNHKMVVVSYEEKVHAIKQLQSGVMAKTIASETDSNWYNYSR